MAATAPLDDDEAVLAEGVVRSRTRGLPRLSYLRVSTKRIALVQHFALRADRLIDIPFAALRDRPIVEGSWVGIEAEHEHGRLRLRVRPWDRTALVLGEPVLRCSPMELGILLDRRD